MPYFERVTNSMQHHHAVTRLNQCYLRFWRLIGPTFGSLLAKRKHARFHADLDRILGTELSFQQCLR